MNINKLYLKILKSCKNDVNVTNRSCGKPQGKTNRFLFENHVKNNLPHKNTYVKQQKKEFCKKEKIKNHVKIYC